ncbi:MAG: flagellar basal body rod protein FlgB [Firmicutes bacterium]|nr:flagellar basal body rod protein FlgB [Bacillota bacterium]
MPIWGRGNNIDLLGQALDYASLRHRLLADNIANVETPGYKRKDANFSAYYRAALGAKVTHPGHIAISPRSTAILDSVLPNSTARNDNNNVDIDLEMAELARNTLYYRSLTRQISQSLANLKMAISEGRR